MKKFFSLNPFMIMMLTLFGVLFIYFTGVEFLEIVEMKTIDFRFKSRGKITPRQDVSLVVVDEKSLAAEGKWPWSRSKIADLVDKLSDAGARVLAFDIGFLEQDENYKKVVQTVGTVKSHLDSIGFADAALEETLSAITVEADNDQRLSRAMKNSSAEVVLGFFFHMGDEELRLRKKEDLDKATESISTAAYNIVSGVTEGSFPKAVAPQPSIEIIANSANYSGYFNMQYDGDGTVRRMIPAIEFNNDYYAPLSLKALAAYFETGLRIKIDEIGSGRFFVGELEIPMDASSQLFINYRGGTKTFPHISATDVLNDNFQPELVKDRIILLGATAIAIYDLRVTPFEPYFPGLEVHANIIDMILTEDFIYRPEFAFLYDFLAIFLAGIFLWIVLPRAGVLSGALAGISVFLGYILLCNYLFSSFGVILNMVYPTLMILAVYTGITAYRYFAETRQKRYIKDAFSKYLAPSVVKTLIDNPDKLVLGGEERVITAFFSDLQSFTSISESLAPDELVELLNEFLTEMTDIILKHKGTVDKFEGDAIIAFFGAPTDLENQSLSACKASIEMQKRLAELRSIWMEQGKKPIKMRIGLCTGPAVVGNMGSRNRFDYTMMGDTVNTAARLEGVNKVYGTYSLISETTMELANEEVVARELDIIKVVGREEEIRIFELLGNPDDFDDKTKMAFEFYAEGLSAYRDRDWGKAESLFNKVLNELPEDGPAKTMIKRCHEYRQNPPPEDWGGIYRMTTK
jgi:adenylate cyclase